ncbi:MAG TPA: sigma-70 family RNA polymerase sigma factor, partial [Flavobacteriales bacterium]|nr:sigma-70 family RNA polymerase sigma factor [Flavobacteriales bacterium]
MKKHFEALKQHKSNNDQAEFNKVLEQLLPRLQKYIEHRIKVYEAKGWLPKNFYAPADVLADVYLNAFKEFERIHNESDLKVRLFSWADQIIGDYAAKENRIPKSKKLPVDQLLKEELKYMYEDLTADADGEVVLVNDLKDEDIEYQQDEFKPKVYLFDFDTQNAFAESLGLTADDFRDEKLRSIFGSIYSQLPETARRVLDLSALGGLTYGEIAEIVGIKPEEV